MIPEVKDDRHLRALKGIPTEKWNTLQDAFGKALEEEKERVYLSSLNRVNVSGNQGEVRKGNCPEYMINCFFFFMSVQSSAISYLMAHPTLSFALLAHINILGEQFACSYKLPKSNR